MIEEVSGDLLLANVEALVNAVNTVGSMSTGFALEFKTKFPDNFDAYRRACTAGQLSPGKMFFFDRSPNTPHWIVNFPTKRHWGDTTTLEDIRAGLFDLVDQIRARGIRSVAIPALGCGMGGLGWNEVRALIAEAFSTASDVHVYVFPPRAAR